MGSRAFVHLGLGNEKEALDLFERLAQRAKEGFTSWYLSWFSAAPWFDFIRDRPRFQKILKRFGLEPEPGAVLD